MALPFPSCWLFLRLEDTGTSPASSKMNLLFLYLAHQICILGEGLTFLSGKKSKEGGNRAKRSRWALRLTWCPFAASLPAKGADVRTPRVQESRLRLHGRRFRSRGEHEPQANPTWDVKRVKPRALLTHKSKKNSQWGCHQKQSGSWPREKQGGL